MISNDMNNRASPVAFIPIIIGSFSPISSVLRTVIATRLPRMARASPTDASTRAIITSVMDNLATRLFQKSVKTLSNIFIKFLP